MPKTIKLMEYNVLYGFHQLREPSLPNPPFDEHRLHLAQQIVKQENPDVLLLTEACFGVPIAAGKTLDYQALFSYPYYYYARDNIDTSGSNGDEWGKCLLSKFPFKATVLPFPYVKRGQARQKTYICAHIAIGDKILHLDGIHPSPLNTDAEKIDVLQAHAPAMQLPYVLAGDFNSLSDEDLYEYHALYNMLLPSIKERAKIVTDNLMARTFIPYLRSIHLTDVFSKEKRHFTVPTDLLSKNKTAGTRLDHFFVSTWDIRVEDAYVVVNSMTEQASDHYPIVCILSLL